MKLRTRFVLLLGGLLAAFALAIALLQLTQGREVERIHDSVRRERSELTDRLLALTGQNLAGFAADYSLWDEMVRFVKEGDPAWAAINIDPSLASFNAQQAWVVRPNFTVLYTTRRTETIAPLELPLHDAAFQDLLRTQPSLHFFTTSAAGVFEVRSGAILPSDDIKRVGTPQGWFVVARRWDDAHLATLGNALQATVTLGGAASRPDSIDVIRLERQLPGWRSETVATLRVEYVSPALTLLATGNQEESYLVYGFGVVVISAILLCVTLWIVAPMQRLKESLETAQTAPLASLLRSPDEFGEFARQVSYSFVQRDALRRSEESLRQSIALRARLARDLHDGIIQSLYAAGLGLESARTLRPTDPEGAEKRLASTQKMLNDALWQVRNFIDALEPEQERTQSAAQSLATLAASMQALQPVPIVVDIDPNLTAKIGAAQETQLLQMARELLSNAVRHANASQVRISFRAHQNDRIRLEVSDDGVGFDPTERMESGGRGLSNLAARAREIDGHLEIDSAVGKGARITVWFRPMS